MFLNFNKHKLEKKGFFAIWGSLIGAYALMIVFQLILAVVAGLALGSTGLITGMDGSTLYLELFMTLGTVAAVCLMAFAIHKWKKADVGLRLDGKGWKEYGVGILVGLGMLLSSMAPGFLAKKLTFSFVENIEIGMLIVYAIGFVIQSFSEEFLFRGYMMPRLSQKYNIYFVLFAQAIIFSLVHASNPNVSILGLVNIFLIGMVFGMLIIVTDNIMLASGLHFLWNYAQGCIFGINVSGLSDMPTILECQNTGSVFLTGGDFGVEGSFITSIVSIIVCIALLPAVKKTIKAKTLPIDEAAIAEFAAAEAAKKASKAAT